MSSEKWNQFLLLFLFAGAWITSQQLPVVGVWGWTWHGRLVVLIPTACTPHHARLYTARSCLFKSSIIWDKAGDCDIASLRDCIPPNYFISSEKACTSLCVTSDSEGGGGVVSLLCCTLSISRAGPGFLRWRYTNTWQHKQLTQKLFWKPYTKIRPKSKKCDFRSWCHLVMVLILGIPS